MRVADKVVVVSGGAGGLGAASARMMASEGARIVLTDLSQDAVEAVGKEIGADAFQHDVTREDDWDRIVSAVLERHGRIDALVHCAGIEGDRERAGVETSLAEWNKVLAINLTSTFLGCRAVVGPMRGQGAGSIVLLSSVVGLMAAKTGISYGVSKAGVIQLARTFAAIGWQGEARVRCNAVLPGAIKTGMTNRLFEGMAQKGGMTGEQIEAKMREIVPLGSRGEPDDIASMILYLVSDESRYVTGASMVVDGGWTVIEEP